MTWSKSNLYNVGRFSLVLNDVEIIYVKNASAFGWFISDIYSIWGTNCKDQSSRSLYSLACKVNVLHLADFQSTNLYTSGWGPDLRQNNTASRSFNNCLNLHDLLYSATMHIIVENGDVWSISHPRENENYYNILQLYMLLLIKNFNNLIFSTAFLVALFMSYE